jgi:DNA-binding transcriptional ArsR family regulator
MSQDRISQTLAAIAHPARRAILMRLRQGEASVKELAEPFEMSVPAVSKHLKVLENAGLISRSRNAQLRPCRLEPEPLREALDWLQEFAEFWNVSLDRLDGLLDELQAPDSSPSR